MGSSAMMHGNSAPPGEMEWWFAEGSVWVSAGLFKTAVH